jgi:hypothetical protein
VAAACRADADCRARLEAACREALVAWESVDLHGYASGLAESVGPACRADPRKDGDCELEEHLEVLAERPEDVRAELGP